MAQKPHLLFRNPLLGTETFRYKGRFSGEEEEEEQQPNYDFLSQEYGASLRQFNTERNERVNSRDTNIAVPGHILYIDIEFFGWFDGKSFEAYYLRNFGLSAVKYYQHNRHALFSIVDNTRFAAFIEQIELFIQTNDHARATYDRRIRYIKSFRLLSTPLLMQDYSPDRVITTLNLVEDLQGGQRLVNAIEESLIAYLRSRNLQFSIETTNNTIEMRGVNQAEVERIVRNFDIVHSVNSNSYGVIRPSALNTPLREYPFTVTNPGKTSPIVGIIDTGVSPQTPLSTILVNTNNDYGANGADPRVDAVDHGTAVAALASLGTRLSRNVTGSLTADARILSIKILEASPGGVTLSEVERLIRKSRAEVGTEIYVLTINFTAPIKNDSAVSHYAYLLDKLTYELDILIFICTANNNPDGGLTNNHVQNYPNWFLEEFSNLCTPSESMNNLSVGAIGDNLEPERASAITIGSLPSIYTRKYHLLAENMFQTNRHLNKPDVVFCGGNYENDRYAPTPEGDSAMRVLSASRMNFFARLIGTSYSAPLLANFALQIRAKYPTLRIQTIKALIVNSASPIVFSDAFASFTNSQKRAVVGSGRPDLNKCITSDDNEVTLILEDSIQPGDMKSYILRIPPYLRELGKNIGLLEVTATLCFKFNPVQNNHLAYCPVHISFGFFRNVALRGNGNFVNKNGDIAFKNNLGWSQDGYFKSKMFSNCQKERFTISRDELVAEDNTFKIAINSKLHGILPPAIANSFNQIYDFSIVIRLKEQLPERKLTGNLYEELRAINTLVVVGEAEAEIEGDLEV